jgi:hypothetical protein|tara:strand:+ start:322 stop:681 length:360 start_codon:yes stop_codon:yes gene_type:complete
MMLGNKPLTVEDLKAMGGPGQLYKHENSIAGSKKAEIKEEDLRSLRSEFDYANKKKFTDVLTESQRGLNPNGLRGLENLPGNGGKKGLDGQSLRSLGSKNSKTTSFKKRLNSIALDSKK